MKNKFGLNRLLRKSFSIISSVSTLLLIKNEAKAYEIIIPEGRSLTHDNLVRKTLKPKLVLKLNLNSLENSMLAMHRSHSSHSSHSSHMSSSTSGHYSHASHSSHSSHISSSPSYYPSSTPSNTPSSSNSGYSNTTPSYNYSNTTPVKDYTLGSRTMKLGCMGSDVEQLQQLLVSLGYDITVTQYFGESTQNAVIQFQKSKNLQADGVVGPQTLSAIIADQP